MMRVEEHLFPYLFRTHQRDFHMIILPNNILHPLGRTFSLHALPEAVVLKPSQLPPPKAAALERRTWKVRPCRFQPGKYLAQPNFPINVPLPDNLLSPPAASSTTVLPPSPPFPYGEGGEGVPKRRRHSASSPGVRGVGQNSATVFRIVPSFFYEPPVDWVAPSREVHTFHLRIIPVEPFQGTHCHRRRF
jgi:hypothetical protein